MIRRMAASLLGLSMACAAVGVGYAAKPAAPALLSPRLEAATVWTDQAAVADTLVMQARWNLPATDRQGKLDSITVNFSNLSAPGWVRVTVPVTAVAATLRQPLPAFDATWELRSQVCTWRRGKVTCVDTMVPYEYTVAPPPGVTALTLTARGVP